MKAKLFGKKLMSVLLCCVMLFGVLPLTAAAESDPNYTFNISEGSIEIVDGTTDGKIKVIYKKLSDESYTMTDEFDPSQEITVTGETTSSGYTLKINTAKPVTIRAKNLKIDNSNDSGEYWCAMALATEGANVTLILEDANSFYGGRDKAGIVVNAGSTLKIEGEGSVTAKGGAGYGGAGIGGDGGANGGTIIIESGTVNATGGTGGAGIGGGCKYHNRVDGGTVIITGGNVTATGDSGGAGIGGGKYGSGGTAIIIGGNVTATGGSGGANIGAGSEDTDNGAGIKPTGDNQYEVYGALVLPDDLTIPQGKTLTIPSGTSLTVPEGKTLTVKGSVTGEGYIKRSAPDSPTAESVTTTSVTLNAITDAEYSMDGTTWQDDPTFNGLSEGTSYTFYARYKAYGIYNTASDKSEGASIATASVPAAEEPERVPVRDTVTIEIGGEKEENKPEPPEENPVTGATVFVGAVLGALAAAR